MAGTLGTVKQRVVISCFNRSGLFHYASQLVNALAKTNQWEILLLTSEANPIDLVASHPSVKVVTFKAPHTAAAFPWATIQHVLNGLPLTSVIKDFQPDVIHIVDSYPWYMLYSSLWRQYPLCVTIHDPTSHQGEKLGFIVRAMNRYLIRQAQQLVVHGQTLKEMLIKQFAVASDRISVIPHGNYEFFSQWATGVTPPPNSVLFFGRLVAYKGLDTLVQAMTILQERKLPTHLTIAGEGNLKEIGVVIPESLHGMITVDNRYIPDQAVAPLFEQHAVVVLPYREASQSGIIPIAFSLKRPVIATKVGALQEVITHAQTGWLIPPNDAEALAEAISHLLAQSALRLSLAEQAFKYAQHQLGWPQIAEQYGQVYQRII